MKTYKILPIVLLVGACAVSTHAQKLRYVPQAIKGAKAVPYVVKPELPTTVRTGFAMPVVRPNVAAQVAPAVERAVAKKVTLDERLARLDPMINDDVNLLSICRLPDRYDQLIDANRADYDKYIREQRGKSHLPKKVLAQVEMILNKLEEVSRANEGIIPQKREYAFDLSLAYWTILTEDCFFEEGRPLARRYNLLIIKDEWVRNQKKKQIQKQKQQREEQLVHELRAQEQAAEERAWHQVLLQDKAWKAQPEEMADPAENAKAAARLVEEQIVTPQTITDDYINQLLQFYNKLDPYGTGTIQ